VITRLRRRHRWLAPLSFALAIGVFAAALAARPTTFAWRHGGRDLLRVESGLVAVLPEGGGTLTVSAGEAVPGPDLAYYASEGPASDGRLPADAVFLTRVSFGAPTEVALDAVPGLAGAPRFVHAHSLGWDRVVATAPVRGALPTADGPRATEGR